MLGKKTSLLDEVKKLNVYSKALSAVNAPNVFRIYVITKHEKHIDCLVMQESKFLGFRAIKASRTFKIFDIKEEEVYDVYKYQGDDSMQLALIDVQCIYAKYMRQTYSFVSLSTRNEECEKPQPIRRVTPIKVGITFQQEHQQLLNYIEENNTPIVKGLTE